MMKCFFLFLWGSILTLSVFAQNLVVTNTRCENKLNPVGIENLNPKLSWQLQSKFRGVKQIAYRIIVSDDPGLLDKNIGNAWDSKKVNSNQSIQVVYKGKNLLPAKMYYWKVLVWDNKKNVSTWAPAACWQTGLLSKADWLNAAWIAYEKLHDSLKIIPAQENRGVKGLAEVKNTLPMLRKEFDVAKKVKRATMFISGLGHFELSLNALKIGDHFLDPGWTQYDKEALYVTFDVTHNLKQGANAIGVLLGNGFYFIPRQRYRKLTGAFGFPKMVCRLLIEFEDGSTKNIVSDKTWKAAPSPIVFSSIYGGEDYNANLEQPGWNSTSFNDAAWKNVLVVDGPELKSQLVGPVKVMQTFSPVKTTKVKDSAYVYDMGQNASGIPAIIVKGKKGDTLRIVPGELLNENGTVTQRASGSPYYLQYILKGGSSESWQPGFTYYGFRYLQVENAVPVGEPNPAKLPVTLSLKTLHTRNSAERLGEFTSSSNLFNRTNALIDWSVKSNFQSVLTDCPHREKLGWLEQVHLMGNSIRYNYDVLGLYKKTIKDMKLAQTQEGLVPEIAPEYVRFDYGAGMFRDSPEWGSNCIILPWYLYQWYGEWDVLKDAYPMMQKYIDYLKTKADNNILSQGLGDWYDLGPKSPGVSQLTPMGVTGTAFYYYDLKILEKTARLIGKPADALGYEKLAIEVRNAFNGKFFNKTTKQYATGSQTANAMAVYMGLVQPADKEVVIQNLVSGIEANNNALTAGDIGYRYVLRVLEDAGRSDVIFNMNSRDDVPGYGYQLAKGATALTESWQALPTVSNNHLMLGHLMEWFYSGLAGIRQEEGSIAFREIVIRPEPVGDVTFAKASHQSLYGLISSSWSKQPGKFELNIEIPVNTTGIVYLPARTSSVIFEGGRNVNDIRGIKISGFESGRIKLHVGSGVYSFLVKD